MQLLVATHNAHKTAEIAAMLGDAWEVRDLTAHPHLTPPEETGATFADNATLKALAASRHFPGALVLSDDSGLAVDALGGAPGVRSARYAGETATDAENRAKLLRELAATGARGPARSARFCCVLAIAMDGVSRGTFAGTVEGIITNGERGDRGFGYDSLFIPAGHCETFAQLPPETKNALSHRARAMEKVCAFLRASPSAPH